MNLRDKIEKEITEKVMTKLASERVELGLVDDLKKLDKSLKDKESQYNRALDESGTLVAKLNRAIPQAQDRVKANEKINSTTSQEIKSALSSVKKADTLAKELGLDASKINGYSSVLKSVETLEKRTKTLNDTTNKLKKLL